MPDCTIFYSWQSDAPVESNKKFIASALNVAVAGRDIAIAPAERIMVDQGMKDVAGSPEVATILFEKIGESAIFLGDTTLVGQVTCTPGSSKYLLNPNVAIEQGFAAGVLGWNRIICVMNEHFGKAVEQPFDTRNRRFPITYDLDPTASSEERDATRKLLVADLTAGITTVLSSDLKKARKIRDRLDVYGLAFLRYFHGTPYFPEPVKPDPNSEHHFLRDLGIFGRCVNRLLDLGVLHSDINNESGQWIYSYHWTYLGKQVGKLVDKHWPILQPSAHVGPKARSASNQ